MKKSKFPNIQKGSFSVQQSQLQQTRYQATLSNLFWPFSKISFEPYSDDIEGANFYKNISAPNNLNIDYTIKINASSGGICQTAISNSLVIDSKLLIIEPSPFHSSPFADFSDEIQST